MQPVSITLLQPDPKTGDFTCNAADALSLVREAENGVPSDLIVMPLGTVEGIVGTAAFSMHEMRQSFETARSSLLGELTGRTVLLVSDCGHGPEYVFQTPAGRTAGAWAVFRAEVCGVTLGAPGQEADIAVDAARPSRIDAPRQALNCLRTVTAAVCGGHDTQIHAGDTGARAGKAEVRLPRWNAAAMAVKLSADDVTVTGQSVPRAVPVCADERYEALRTAVRDYVAKNGIRGVVLGLSGGIDSALVATLAADAIGAERVRCVRLPSRFTSGLSNDAAEDLARRQHIQLDTLPIESLFKEAVSVLSPVFENRSWDLTEENIQARIRSLLLMGVANKFGLLLLCTSNKAEAAMGYGTLYGDITGGFAPLVDLWKEDVVALCRARNASPADPDVIPVEIIEREPSAELHEGQKDSDSLPPYPLIAAVVTHVARGGSLTDLPAGTDPVEAQRIVRMLLANGFKRAQSIPGPVLTDTPLSAFAAWGVNRARFEV